MRTNSTQSCPMWGLTAGASTASAAKAVCFSALHLSFSASRAMARDHLRCSSTRVVGSQYQCVWLSGSPRQVGSCMRAEQNTSWLRQAARTALCAARQRLSLPARSPAAGGATLRAHRWPTHPPLPAVLHGRSPGPLRRGCDAPLRVPRCRGRPRPERRGPGELLQHAQQLHGQELIRTGTAHVQHRAVQHGLGHLVLMDGLRSLAHLCLACPRRGMQERSRRPLAERAEICMPVQTPPQQLG